MRPDNPARIMIDESAGIIVIGENVRITETPEVVVGVRLGGSGGCRGVDSASAVEDHLPGMAHMQGIDANPGPRRHEARPVV